MKAKLSTTLIILFFLLMFFSPFIVECSYALQDWQMNPFDYARITDVEYKAVVVDEPDSEGKVVITERLTFDIHAASSDNLFWELWRDLPEDYIDGVKVHYKVNSVKEILDDGTEVIYDESPKLYWDDYDYVSENPTYGPGKWYHSEGPYNEDYERYECVFFYVDGLYREEVVFEIEYEMYNAALKYNDCSDLYLALYSEASINHLESFEAQILFPNEDMPRKGNYEVYSYGTNANEFTIKESDSKNPGYYTFYFDLDEDDLKFRPYNQYIEFDLVAFGEDKHIFTEYAPSNIYTGDDVLEEIYDEQEEYASTPKKYAKLKTIVFILMSVIAIITLLKALTAKARMKSKYVFYEPTTKYDYFREIPSDLDPNFAAALVFCKHKTPKDDSGVYSAILLSLARKNYVELREQGTNDIQIILKYFPPQLSHKGTPLDAGMDMNAGTDDVLEPLTRCEQYYFNLLVRHAKSGYIYMSNFQQRIISDYEHTDTFALDMKNSVMYIGTKDGYFQKAEYNQPRKELQSSANRLMVVGILVTTLVNIISYQTRMDFAYGAYFISGLSCIVSSIIKRKQARDLILLTQYGEDEYAKWRGLYNFLNSTTLIHERTVIELPLWEKYLVYAAAFGLSEKVIKAVNIRCPEASENVSTNRTYYRSSRFHHSGRSFRSSVRTGSSTARSFSGGGGGFGYGGGGRGGGGGGGGH